MKFISGLALASAAAAIQISAAPGNCQELKCGKDAYLITYLDAMDGTWDSVIQTAQLKELIKIVSEEPAKPKETKKLTKDLANELI